MRFIISKLTGIYTHIENKFSKKQMMKSLKVLFNKKYRIFEKEVLIFS